MFSRAPKDNAGLVRVKLVTVDRSLEERIKRDFATGQRFVVDTVQRSVTQAVAVPGSGTSYSVVIVDVDPRQAQDIASLEAIIAASGATTPVIVLSDDLGSSAARRLLHLKVADWLPRAAPTQELQQACDRAIDAKHAVVRTNPAKVFAFYPAMGGVGNTTLALATSFSLAKLKRKSTSVCLVDLDFQSGTLAIHLNLPANVQLDDLVLRPDRLDSHLLDVLLSRHASGVALLAAPNTLTGLDGVSPAFVARLLDLVAVKFDNVVIDLPVKWMPWSQDVLRGADHFFVVTDLSVPGLRQARRVVDEIQQRFDLPTQGRVIVNKTGWFGRHGVKKSDAFEALGDRLLGFVSDATALVNQSRNRGIPLAELKRSNTIGKDIDTILKALEQPS